MKIYKVNSRFPRVIEVEVTEKPKCYVSASGKIYKKSNLDKITEGIVINKFHAFSLDLTTAIALLKVCMETEINVRQKLVDENQASIKKLNELLQTECELLKAKVIED